VADGPCLDQRSCLATCAQLSPEAEASLDRSVRELAAAFDATMVQLRSELLVQATEDADQHMVTLAARLDFNGARRTVHAQVGRPGRGG